MLKVVSKDTNTLKPYERNALKHSDKQICKIASSMAQFGCNNPILIDKSDTIIAGHSRWAAAKKLRMKEVPTICLDHLSPDEVRAYIIADNKLAELVGWDRDILAIELQHLSSIDLNFDLEITGFEADEIDFIIGGLVAEKLDPADEVTQPETEAPAVTKRGDLWILGDHRLYCGDSLDEASYSTLMGAEKAQMVFTDPPYNVPITGYVCGNGTIQHAEFEMAIEEALKREFREIDSLKSLLSLDYDEQHKLIESIFEQSDKLQIRYLVFKSVNKVVIELDNVKIFVDRGNLLTEICNNLNLPLPHVTENDVATITVSIEMVKPKTGAFVVEAKTKNDTRDPFDRKPQELKNWVRGVIWRDQHFNGMTIRQIAQEFGCSDSLVDNLIAKSFTAL